MSATQFERWCLEFCNMLSGASSTPVARLCGRLAALGLLDALG
jgi:hypothetical protein